MRSSRKLAVHVGVEIGIPVAVVGAAVVPVGGAARIVVGIVPIELRIIEEELDALAVALVGEHLQRIFLVRRALHDVPVGNFGVEHREAIMMARGDGDVLHAGGLGERDPCVGVEFFGIEKCRQALVFVDFQLAVVEYPFAVAEDAIDAPVNEHAEFHVLKFAAGLQVFGRWLVAGLGRCVQCCEKNVSCKGYKSGIFCNSGRSHI